MAFFRGSLRGTRRFVQNSPKTKKNVKILNFIQTTHYPSRFSNWETQFFTENQLYSTSECLKMVKFWEDIWKNPRIHSDISAKYCNNDLGFLKAFHWTTTFDFNEIVTLHLPLCGYCTVCMYWEQYEIGSRRRPQPKKLDLSSDIPSQSHNNNLGFVKVFYWTTTFDFT